MCNEKKTSARRRRDLSLQGETRVSQGQRASRVRTPLCVWDLPDTERMPEKGRGLHRDHFRFSQNPITVPTIPYDQLVSAGAYCLEMMT